MTELLKFLQSSTGENSSKRLAFIIALLIACFGVINSSNRMIDTDHADLALSLWQSFFLFVGFLGGFVTAELLIKLLEIFKNANPKINTPTDSRSSNAPCEFPAQPEQRTEEGN